VTGDGLLRVKKDGKVKAEIPSQTLVLGGGAPRYVREEKRPAYLDIENKLDVAALEDLKEANVRIALEKMISTLNISSRKPLYEQYDTDVGLVKITGPGLDGGLARVPGTNKGIAVATDCNSRYTYLNPHKGAMWAVCESARNVFVTGAKPIGITNNLNFANPYIPENYYVFSECVKGIGDACRYLKLPVTGGNVSFYNESPEGPVFPTPTIGMVGLIENISNYIKNYFTKPNQSIALIGRFKPTLGGSEYLKEVFNVTKGEIPELSLEDELNLQNLVLELNENKLISSAKDLSLGGLIVAICKMAFPSHIGVNLDLTKIRKSRLDETLFGETSASVLITFESENVNKVKTLCEKHKLEFNPIGNTIGEKSITINGLGSVANLDSLEEKYESALVKIFE
nr:phosphoribosylformylglycinamidine synthase subunit PurL [Leptospiraceae bacterium]